MDFYTRNRCDYSHFGGHLVYLVPRLPDVNSLRDYHLQTPLRVMSRDGKLISEFGEQRRIPLTIDQVPQLYIDALLSAEDENFYSHYGVDPKALLRAAVRMVQAGGKIQGAVAPLPCRSRGITC